MAKFDFISTLWLFPITLAAHELEEWNILEWYSKHFKDMPSDKSNTSTRFFLIFLSVICFLWTGVAVSTGSEQYAVWVMLPFVAIVVLNIFQHIYWLILLKSWSPGTTSAIILLLPVNSYILYFGLSNEIVPWWILAVLTTYWATGIRETVIAGNTLNKSFKKINKFTTVQNSAERP